MKSDAKQQVLLALYTEYQKDLPKMKNITCTALNMDIDVFNTVLEKLSGEGYIQLCLKRRRKNKAVNGGKRQADRKGNVYGGTNGT